MKTTTFLKVSFLPALAFVLASAILPGVHADSRPGAPTTPWQLKPQAIPTTLTNICTLVSGSGIPPCGRDLYVCIGDVSMSPAGSAINVSIRDNQASPVYYWNAVPIAGATASTGAGYKIFEVGGDIGCRWFPRGVSILASASGAFIYLGGKY